MNKNFVFSDVSVNVEKVAVRERRTPFFRPSGYKTTSEYTVAPMRFHKWQASEIKSRREDFNDMFKAEATARAVAGDLSVVFVLTYNDEHLRTKYGQNFIDSWDLRMFAKSSRFCKMLRRKYGYIFDFVCVGEYGNGGESHGYVGKRGRGQNPHFHCVGWFHNADKIQGVENAQIYSNGSLVADGIREVLPMLLRLEWQGCCECDIYNYAKSAEMRSLGLGFVRLDGEIRSADRGGSYIGKYIGKDIQKSFQSTYLPKFFPTVLTELRSVASAFVDKYSYGFNSPELVDFLIREWLNAPFDTNLLLRNIKSFSAYFVLSSDSPYIPLSIERNEKELFGSLWQCYVDLYDDFHSDLQGRYNPKVRKFRGFGYSLLKDINEEKGTYNIFRNGGVVERMLPPSLFRYHYYDFFKRKINACDWSVCYKLNERGRKLLRERVRMNISRDMIVAKSLGSVNLKDNLLPAVLYRNCLRSFFPTLSVFDESLFSSLLVDVERAVEHAVGVRTISVYGIAERENRIFKDLNGWLLETYPDIYMAVVELDDLCYSLASKKNIKDLDYNNKWFKCFDFNY